MQHLNEEALVLFIVRDDDAPATAQAHLDSCDACRDELAALQRVLALVAEAIDAPPRDAGYGESVWNRLRWKLDRAAPRATTWRRWSIAAAAAVVLIAGGLFVESRRSVTAPAPRELAAVRTVPATKLPAETQRSAAAESTSARLLAAAVGDHLDDSERVLAELANADPSKALDVSTERRKAEELVAANRIYRQSAERRGDVRVAALLSDLEPVLVELAHADRTLTPDEIGSLQKRIDGKGLLFKMRVIGARMNGRERTAGAAGRVDEL